jgi:hypothetical protein
VDVTVTAEVAERPDEGLLSREGHPVIDPAVGHGRDAGMKREAVRSPMSCGARRKKAMSRQFEAADLGEHNGPVPCFFHLLPAVGSF